MIEAETIESLRSLSLRASDSALVLVNFSRAVPPTVPGERDFFVVFFCAPFVHALFRMSSSWFRESLHPLSNAHNYPSNFLQSLGAGC